MFNLERFWFRFAFGTAVAIWLNCAVHELQILGQESAVRLELIDGTSRSMVLRGVSADGELLSDDNGDHLSISFLSAIDFSRPATTAPQDSARILFHGNAVLFAKNLELKGEEIVFESPLVSSPIALSAVHALIWRDHDRVQATLEAALPDNDQVVVNTDDGPVVVAGLLEGLNAEKVQVNYQDQSRTIGKEKVLAIVMARLQESPVAESKLRLKAFLIDGSFLVGDGIELNEKTWSLDLAGNGHVSGSVSALARIEVQTDRQRFLSDLTPTQIEQRVLFGESREVIRDKGLFGPALSIRQADNGKVVEFRKGLAMRATTRASYENSKGFDRLTGLVGLEGESAQQGDCEVTVRGDGIELWKARLNGAIPSAKVDVDIRGYAFIEIAVLPGEQFDLGDFVNWCNLQFLRTGQ